MPEHVLEAAAWPFIAGPAEAPRQAIGLAWQGGDAPPPTRVTLDGDAQHVTWHVAGEQGHRATVFVPLGATPRRVRIAVPDRAQVGILEVDVEPPPRWELFVVPHSHVDIGYTEYQDILFDAHGDYVAQALDLMAATEGRPDEERYRWTCEASWTVQQFLRRHPQREEEFVRRCREGLMEVTALYVNVTDLFSATLLERAVSYALQLRERWGIEVVTACNYDVNGFGWSLPSVLQRAGVRYLDTAINETRALGVRPRPTALRWASPDGASVLLWHSVSYLVGNRLLLHTTRERAEPHVAAFLTAQRAQGYPHHGMEVLISGTTGDSMPPSGAVCDVVAEWNRTWLWPRLRLATTRDWFSHLEQHWPRELVTQQKAWPDWWADGNGSALYEAALVRGTQARLEGLEAQRRLLQTCGVDLGRLEASYTEAWERAMLFCEHTWGPYESAVRPDSPAARGQWYHKAGHAYAADALADTIQVEQMVAAVTGGCVSARAEGLTNATLQGEPSGYLATHDPAAVVVFNPLDEERDDVVEVMVPWHLCRGTPRLRDEATGAYVPARVRGYPPEDVVNARNVRVEFAARGLAPRAHRVYYLDAGEAHPAAPSSAGGGGHTLETAHFLLELDKGSGAIRRLLHKGSGREVVQPGAGYLLNEAIYEQVASAGDRAAVASWRGIGTRDVAFSRTPFHTVRIAEGEPRPWAQSLMVEATGPGGMTLTTEILLPDDGQRVDIVNRLEKAAITRAEALYHAFPLASAQGQIYLDVPGGAVRPGVDQVLGTATDWHAVQDWFAVAADGYTVVVASPDVGLVQCTGINTGLWHDTMPASNGIVMSWVLNNYWFTNFPVRQGGVLTYRYSIAVQDGPFDAARAARFGRHIRQRAWGQAVRLPPHRRLSPSAPPTHDLQPTEPHR